MQYTISVILFACLIACAAGRVAMLRSRGIKAFVFGATDKTDFLLIPFVLAIIYSVCVNAFGFTMWEPLAAPFWDSQIPGWIGVTLCVVGIAGIVASLISFGASFRVGIDEDNPDKLVTGGMFAFSRNPIYVSFDTFFLGQLLIHRNLPLLVFGIGFASIIHRQILREEKFLTAHYGKDYTDYCRKVRRYL
jgi:protein-S-isoprenylcysteine O-methyltransferase Ste14